MLFPRSSGVLLHVTSLPGRFGIGDLGPEAFRFVDYLRSAEATYWQVLPLVPVGFGDSPYASPSTFAGNVTILSPELLVQDNLLAASDLASLEIPGAGRVHFDAVARTKCRMVQIAHDNFLRRATPSQREDLVRFCDEHVGWLDDYALFVALKSAHGERAWTAWPADLRRRDPDALRAARRSLEERIAQEKFGQYLFFRQWTALKEYCAVLGIQIVGDVPIYVAHDSADVWANAHLFSLLDDGSPTHVAGVPPDYFSADGQRWGNPIYRWAVMEKNGFRWWIQRMRAAQSMYDVIRLDHFRGFEAYWEVPASEPTARHGRWVPGPGQKLFDALAAELGQIPIIAEDLGLITAPVKALKERYGFPGMAILQFAFDSGPSNAFLPHNYDRNLWAYTGTHDNETVKGWYFEPRSTHTDEENRIAREYCRRYLGFTRHDETDLHLHFLRALYASVANVVVAPMQDVLGLGGEARMNEPGSVGTNWAWRLADHAYIETEGLLRELAMTYGRAGYPAERAEPAVNNATE